MLHVSKKRRKAVCGGSAILKDTQKILKGVMARKPRMHVRMKRYLGIVFSIMVTKAALEDIGISSIQPQSQAEDEGMRCDNMTMADAARCCQR